MPFNIFLSKAESETLSNALRVVRRMDGAYRTKGCTREQEYSLLRVLREHGWTKRQYVQALSGKERHIQLLQRSMSSRPARAPKRICSKTGKPKT